jgi:hypothetical protein
MANDLLLSSQRIVPEVQIAVNGCIHFAVRLPGMILHLHCTTVFFHTFRRHQTQGTFIDYFVQALSPPVQQSVMVSGACVGSEVPTNSTIARLQPASSGSLLGVVILAEVVRALHSALLMTSVRSFGPSASHMCGRRQ